jgi:transposase-like protein
VRRWKESGGSVREYCRAVGLRESAFYFWRRKLAGQGRPTAAANDSQPVVPGRVPVAPRPERRSSQRSRPSFLPVRLTGNDPTEATCRVEIVLAGGRTVRVRAGFDRQTLVDVLAVLEARPC